MLDRCSVQHNQPVHFSQARSEIVCPRIDVLYTEHKYCGEDDLFGNGHPPDSVVALALAYHALKSGRRPGDYGVTI